MISFFRNNSDRTKHLISDISYVALYKTGNVLSSFVIVPLTINYVSPDIYGIWLTLYSIITWFSIFDIGLGHGLRNHLAQSWAFKDFEKGKKLISTAYIYIIKIAVILFLLSIISIFILDWNKILKIPDGYNENINYVIILFGLGFSLRFIVQLITSIFFAVQKAAASEFWGLVGNIITLLLIITLKNYFSYKLLFLVCAIIFPQVIALLSGSIFFFKKEQYKILTPSPKYYDKSLSNSLFSLGIKFFILQCSTIFSYSIVNFLILQFLTPEDVTKYNIAYKYFSIILIANNIICAPLWSTFTEAYVKQDFKWLNKAVKSLVFIWFGWCIVGFFMVLFSDLFYLYWTKVELNIPLSLSIVLALFMLNCAWNGIFTSFVNGIGKVYIQLLTSIIPLVLWWPLGSLFVKTLNWGVTGFALCMLFFNISSTIFIAIQVNKILKQKATGIWNK